MIDMAMLDRMVKQMEKDKLPVLKEIFEKVGIPWGDVCDVIRANGMIQGQQVVNFMMFSAAAMWMYATGQRVNDGESKDVTS